MTLSHLPPRMPLCSRSTQQLRGIRYTVQQKRRALLFLLLNPMGPERISGRAGWVRIRAFSWVRRVDVFVALFGYGSGEKNDRVVFVLHSARKILQEKYWTSHHHAPVHLKDRRPLLCPMHGSERDLAGKYGIRGIWFQHFWARGRCHFHYVLHFLQASAAAEMGRTVLRIAG